jgi:hypothetical protein
VCAWYYSYSYGESLYFVNVPTPYQLSVLLILHWGQQESENYLPGGYENMLGAIFSFPISPIYERVMNEIVWLPLFGR